MISGSVSTQCPSYVSKQTHNGAILSRLTLFEKRRRKSLRKRKWNFSEGNVIEKWWKDLDIWCTTPCHHMFMLLHATPYRIAPKCAMVRLTMLCHASFPSQPWQPHKMSRRRDHVIERWMTRSSWARGWCHATMQVRSQPPTTPPPHLLKKLFLSAAWRSLTTFHH
jgi:hypothetical protein